MNFHGDVVFTVNLTGNTALDSAIYLNDEILAQAGQPTALFVERIWADSGAGAVAFRGGLVGGAYGIVFENQVFAEPGGPVPGAAPGSTFVGFGSHTPLSLSDRGEVLDWARCVESGQPIEQQDIFVGDQLLVRTGSVIKGESITILNPGRLGLRMDDGGRFVIFKVSTSNPYGAVVILADRGRRSRPSCWGDGTYNGGSGLVSCPCSNTSNILRFEGCKYSQGHGAYLSVQGRLDVADDATTFTVHQARPNQPGLLVQGDQLQSLPFKDGIFCMGNSTERIEVVVTDANGYAKTTNDIAVEGNVLPGQIRNYQMWYRDTGLFVGGFGSHFSQGLRVFWQ